jgi:hypothetical protein
LSLWPSKKQWNTWSTPSKLTAIGTLLAILALGFYFLEKGFNICAWILNRQNPIPPKIEQSLTMLSSKYKPGVEVDGIIWEKEFETHIFSFKNNSESVDLLDLRIQVELPGAIISYKVLDNKGCQDLSLSQDKLPSGLKEKNTHLMTKNIEYYTNNLSINAIKLYPMAKFSINILLSHLVKDHGGIITIKYRYLLPEGKYNKYSVGYPVEYLNKKTNQLFINFKKPITDEYEGHFLFIPKMPITFKPKGAIQQ